MGKEIMGYEIDIKRRKGKLIFKIEGECDIDSEIDVVNFKNIVIAYILTGAIEEKKE